MDAAFVSPTCEREDGQTRSSCFRLGQPMAIAFISA